VYVRDGWLGNLFAVATPFVFFGDDVTVPAVRAAVENVRPRDSGTLFVTKKYDELPCHQFITTSWARTAHLDRNRKHSYQTMCLWHQKIFYQREVAAASQEGTFTFWVDAGGFRFSSLNFSAWPNREVVQTIPADRLIMPLHVPLDSDALAWPRAYLEDTTKRPLANASAWVAAFFADHIYMSAQMYGGSRAAVLGYCSRYAEVFKQMVNRSIAVPTECSIMTYIALLHPETVALVLPPTNADRMCRPTLYSKQHKSDLTTSRWNYIHEWLASLVESRCTSKTRVILPERHWQPETWAKAQMQAVDAREAVLLHPV